MAQTNRIAFVLGACMLLIGTVLQKFALPGSGGLLPISVLLVPLVISFGVVTGVLQVCREVFLLLALVLLVGLCNYVATDGLASSVTSLALLAVSQSSLLFRFSPPITVALPLHTFFRNLVLTISVLGISQFALQFMAGSDAAFLVDRLPQGVIVQGYNLMNPLAWNSPIYKSNGVFLLEPSLFSQLVAVGIALELVAWRNVWRLLILSAAALVSFSGTGLMMLALFLPLYAVAKRQFRELWIAGMLGVIVFAAAAPLGLKALTSRVGEFGASNSSAWARFISPLLYLPDALGQGWWSFLFGQGAGSVQQNFAHLSYGAFDPTWSKVLYEYGFFGAAAYCLLAIYAFGKSKMPLRFPLIFSYFFLGGYLLNPSVIALMASLLTWTSSESFKRTSSSGGRVIDIDSLK